MRHVTKSQRRPGTGQLKKDAECRPDGVSRQPSKQKQLKHLCAQQAIHSQAPSSTRQVGRARGHAKPGTSTKQSMPCIHQAEMTLIKEVTPGEKG